ncbi:hypothetical protein ABEU97_20535 [Priestia megaterium]
MKKTKQQLSIFDEIEYQDSQINDVEFQLKDEVKVKKLEYISYEMSIEDSHVLSLFQGKKGKVIGVHDGTVKSYEVELNTGEKHYFYSRELILLG